MSTSVDLGDKIGRTRFDQLERFGKCGRVTDVDWIAISHALAPEKATKSCSGYKTSAGVALPDLIFLLKDTEVTLYDRRSAGIVAKKIFAQDPTCPRFNFGGTAGTTKDSPPPSEAVRAWLRTKPNR